MKLFFRYGLGQWLLAPLIAGLILTGMPPVAQAQAVINNPDDARALGFDSLGNLMRSGKFNSGNNIQRLVLNPSLKVPLSRNLIDFVKDRKAALVLGKALFWDMQLGSDGIMACASCHFQAGGDVRTRNQVATAGNQVKFARDTGPFSEIIGFYNAPKTNADAFETVAGRTWKANFLLEGLDFPLVITQDAFINSDNIIMADTEKGNRNDEVGSMGLMTAAYAGVTPGRPVDKFTGPLGTTRQVTARNAPPSVNAVFNLFQFWDGRAHPKFNGVNPIGPLDQPRPKYFVDVNGKLQERVLDMEVASLASQSVGPPLSDVEMSFAGRNWLEIGKKLTRHGLMKPLAYQEIDPNDSVFKDYRDPSGKGLTKTYKQLVELAFKNELWRVKYQGLIYPKARLQRTTVDEMIFIPGPYQIMPVSQVRGIDALPNGYTQMEANFSMFFGIAVMLYEAELVSEQSPFDKWMEGNGQDVEGFGKKELDGLNVFVNQGKCIACHSGPEFTNATVRNTRNGAEQIEVIRKRNGEPAFYDNGFYNVGNRPTVDDILRGSGSGAYPWGNSRQFLFKKNQIMNIPFSIPGLPIKGLEARNPQDTNGDGIPDRQELYQVLDNDEILVCYDLNMNGVCDLEDDIVIQALDMDGNAKASSCRNVELNGPYFHNGDVATLQQLLDNYDIGGKFRSHPLLNKVDMLPDIARLDLANAVTPNGTNAEEALIYFLLALTDPRVKYEQAPFDHPQLFIPVDAAAPMLDPDDPNFFKTQITCGNFKELPARGASGGPALQPFHAGLGIDADTGHFEGDTGKGPIVESNTD